MSDVSSAKITPAVYPVADRPGDRGLGVPWAMILPHAAQARRNHSQTLERLAERGGLSWCEALAVLEDRDYKTVVDAKARVLAMVERWKARDAGRIEAAAKVIFARMDVRTDWANAAEEDRTLFRSMARDALQAALS